MRKPTCDAALLSGHKPVPLCRLWENESSGINVAGAIRLARELGPGKTIVTILCDYGSRYQSKLFNPSFLREKGLPTPDWLEAAADVPQVFEG